MCLFKTKSAHGKLQSIKNAWSKDEICCLEMVALPAQGNSESDKYRFNTEFLTGSDYYRYPNNRRKPGFSTLGNKLRKKAALVRGESFQKELFIKKRPFSKERSFVSSKSLFS